MLRRQITIINKLGLHARAAVKLVNTASRFGSQILICYNGHEINAKSVMNVMVIGASKGASIELIVEGDDETEALVAVENLINSRFGEEE